MQDCDGWVRLGGGRVDNRQWVYGQKWHRLSDLKALDLALAEPAGCASAVSTFVILGGLDMPEPTVLLVKAS